MKMFIVICVVFVHCCLAGANTGGDTQAKSGQNNNNRGGKSFGVGAFSYQDTAGHRYGGTYGLRDGQVVDKYGDFGPYADNTEIVNNFFPEYLRNFENVIQKVFQYNYQHQQLALDAARQAFDLTSNQAGFIPNFASRFEPFHGFQGFPGFDSNFGNMPNYGGMGPNSAFAYGAIGPDYTHQIAAINPANPGMGNINVMNRFADMPAVGGYKSVSSSSHSSSSNINGKQFSDRGSETVVNDNGKITKYAVHS